MCGILNLIAIDFFFRSIQLQQNLFIRRIFAPFSLGVSTFYIYEAFLGNLTFLKIIGFIVVLLSYIFLFLKNLTFFEDEGETKDEDQQGIQLPLLKEI